MKSFYLIQALQEAEKYRGFCAPNPAVGAVIVKNNRVIATGYHAGPGQAHAEIMALNQAGASARGADLYVTLEPCCHFGKTPPCVDRIIEEGVVSVFYGFQDPNPLVAGKGIEALMKAGIHCEHVSLSSIDAFYHSYQYWSQYRRPWVTAKMAVSLDGKIAGGKGERIQITGEAAGVFTHQQRKWSDAILTTVRTVNNDNPKMNVRIGEKTFKKPLYILDRNLSLKDDLHIYQTAKHITIFHAKDIDPNRLALYETRGIYCRQMDCEAGQLNLRDVLHVIGEDGIHNLWIEAGGTCFQAFIEAGLVNKAFVYVAPITLGTDALAAFNTSKNVFASVKNVVWQSCGRDVIGEMWW